MCRIKYDKMQLYLFSKLGLDIDMWAWTCKVVYHFRLNDLKFILGREIMKRNNKNLKNKWLQPG